MFEIEGQSYDLKYNLKRAEIIESVIGKPIMGSMTATKGMLSIQEIKVYFAYGLKEIGSDVFVPVKKGMEFAEALIESEGYAAVNSVILEALQRDCPFFFQVD